MTNTAREEWVVLLVDPYPRQHIHVTFLKSRVSRNAMMPVMHSFGEILVAN